jgi:hypothetical protein
VIEPPEEESETLDPVVIFPAPLASESDQSVIDPPEVVSETESLIVVFPEAFRASFPPLVLRFEPTAMFVAFTIRSLATIIPEPELFDQFPAVELSVSEDPAVELLIGLLTVILPVL